MNPNTIYIYKYFCNCGYCDGDSSFYLCVPPEVAKAFREADDAIENHEFLERQGYVFDIRHDPELTRERQKEMQQIKAYQRAIGGEIHHV